MRYEHLYYCNLDDAEKLTGMNIVDGCKIVEELSPLVKIKVQALYRKYTTATADNWSEKRE